MNKKLIYLRLFKSRICTGVGAIRVLSNWLTVLSRIVGSYFGVIGGDLEIVTRNGVTMVCPNLPMVRDPIFEVFVNDQYRLRQLDRFVSDDSVIVDIGAHIGSFVLAAAARWSRCKIYCYEPSFSSYSLLEANIERNSVNARVFSVRTAVGATSGTATFYELQEGSCENSMCYVSGADKQIVDVKSFDDVVASVGGLVDLLKIDCEGSEYEIILESKAFSWIGVKAVLLEYHPVKEHNVEQLRNVLLELGFECVWDNPLNIPGLGMSCWGRLPNSDLIMN